MRVNAYLEAFNAGEFGPRMDARVAFDKYRNAGSTYQNILPLPQGGYTRRPGFRFIDYSDVAGTGASQAILLPFEYSTTDAYILGLYANTMTFYRNQASIAASNIAESITNGTFASNITGWTDQSNGTGAISWNSTGANMALAGAGSGNEAIAEQAPTSADTNERVLKFEIVGQAGQEVTVRIGTSSGASDILADTEVTTGYHCIQFTPGAVQYYIQFENSKNRTIYVDNVSLADGAKVSISTPWPLADLYNLMYAQSADVIFFALGHRAASGNTRVYKLTRSGHASWSLTLYLFEDGPYLPVNTTATTLTLGATSGLGVTVTASAVTGINDDAGFRATDVGRLIRWKDSGNKWTWMQIVTFTDTTHVKVDILGATAAATTATANWRLGEWNDTDGWPSVVSFIQQRSAFAATSTALQKFWLSKSAVISDFSDEDTSGTVQDDNSISYKFAARKVNVIQWIATRKKPVIGTVGAEWTLRSEAGAVLTPTDIAADQETSSGSARIPPIEASNRLLFVQTGLRKIVEFADTIESSGSSGFNTFDVTLLNDRILTSGLLQIQYAQEPDSTVWGVRTDGLAVAMTYQPEQQVVGWSRHIPGGTYNSADAEVVSIAVIPGRDGSGQFKDSTGRDEVWACIHRDINGSDVYYVECMEKIYNGDEDLQEEAFYVDSGLTLDNPITISAITKADPGVVTTSSAHGLSNGNVVRIVRCRGMTEVNAVSFIVANKTTTTFELTDLDGIDVDTTDYGTYDGSVSDRLGEVRLKVTSVTGLAHLEGETVSILADGAEQNTKVVASGAIALDDAASVVHVGLSYEHVWRSLKLAYGGQSGTSVGKFKTLSQTGLILLETIGSGIQLSVEDSDGETTLDPLAFQTGFTDEAPAFFTGETEEIGLNDGYDRDTRLIIRGSAPGPVTVLGLTPELETNDA